MVLVMTVLGGKGLLVGPFVGAAVVLTLQDVLSLYTDSWQLVVGALFVAMVMVAPAGVAGSVANAASAWLSGRRKAPRGNGAPHQIVASESKVVKLS
jgi:branched-chain amino acid transport system permease protein